MSRFEPPTGSFSPGSPPARTMPAAGRNAALIDALAAGLGTARAAKASGYSPATVKRRRDDESFMGQVRERRAELLAETAAQLGASGSAAVATLLRLLSDGNPAGVRLGAAKALLAAGLDYRAAVELEARLAAVEAAVDAADAADDPLPPLP